MNKEKELSVSFPDVEKKIVVIRNMEVIADADVAALYGVTTRRINEAVRNNPEKFPDGYMFSLNYSELRYLMSKISTSNISERNRKGTKVFTERGLDVGTARRMFAKMTEL